MVATGRADMVQARSTVYGSCAVILGTLLMAACAQAPTKPVGEPVAVELGPVIRLLDLSTSHESVHALVDEDGFGHVVIELSKARMLRHLVVDPAGTISLDELVRSDVNPGSLDAAFDADRRLHVLVGPRHFVRESSGQWSEAATPWAAAGLDALSSHFVPGNERNGPLLYAFDVRGKALDAPARWDVYGFGGYGAGIIWPWRTRGTRLAVVAEDGGRYDTWSVVDLDGREDVADWHAIADADGGVHVVYDAQRSVLAQMSLARHACIAPSATADGAALREIAGHHVRAVSGSVIPVTPEAPSVGLSAAVGFSAVTGELLLVRQHVGGRVLHDGRWSPDVLFPLELAFEPRVATRATSRFDVVVTGDRTDSSHGNERPVLYLQFREGRWSAPVEVAGAEVDSLFGSIWDAVQIASDGHERVLVTWPARDGIEACWLRVRGD